MLSFIFLPNLTYRLLCLVGFVAMIFRGGEKRLLAIAAAGIYAIYVVLTCVFYYVGLAYDNVSEVTLFVLFMGGIDGAPSARVGPPVADARHAPSHGRRAPEVPSACASRVCSF